MAQQNQQLLAKHARILSEETRPMSPGLQNDETFLTVCSAQINTGMTRIVSSMQRLSDGMYGRGEQGTQFEHMAGDMLDKKTLYRSPNGEPTSYGSISGLDPRAVVEIEHLIQS